MKSIAKTSYSYVLPRNTWWVICLLTALLTFLFIACGKDDPPAPVPPNLSLIAENIAAPLSVVEPPDDTKRLFIVDQIGKVWIIPPGAAMLTTPFMDISSRLVALDINADERGLLSLAFHPNFRSNGKFYVFYTAPPRAGGPLPGTNWNNLTRISEFKVSASNPNLADLSSERIILEADHPQTNHNGGTVAFGPDGYLYIGIGDGGAADDAGIGHVPDWYVTNAGGNAQNVTANLMGKILRINVNSGTPYSIPPDNPYANHATAKKEIYALGFRNPYRFSFDKRGNRGLYVGDVGQVLFEEVNLVTKGGNFGWNVKEGTICFNTDNSRIPRASCPSVDSAGNPLIDPIIQIKNKAHPDGTGRALAVIGGNIYRGSTFPQFQGKYIFGNFSMSGTAQQGELFVASPSSSGQWTFEDLKPRDYPTHLGYFLKGFGEDQSGELYITVSSVFGMSGTTGKVFKLVAAQ